MGASYQRQCYMLLSGALTYAVKMNWIDKHPLANIETPSVPKKNKEWTENDDWSRNAITELLNIENKTQMELFVSIALMCGLRIGEILAIEEDDIDFKNRKIELKSIVTQKKSIKFRILRQNRLLYFWKNATIYSGKKSIEKSEEESGE